MLQLRYLRISLNSFGLLIGFGKLILIIIDKAFKISNRIAKGTSTLDLQ